MGSKKFPKILKTPERRNLTHLTLIKRKQKSGVHQDRRDKLRDKPGKDERRGSHND